jgi:hypothetical protein
MKVFRNSFKENGLIYESAENTWYKPSECLWTSPTPISGKAILDRCYDKALEVLFVTRLGIPAASSSTIVEGLNYQAQRNASIPEIKDSIWAINSMNPRKGDVDLLLIFNNLSITQPLQPNQQNGSTVLQSSETQFFVNDRPKLKDIFQRRTPMLDFTLEEVRQLQPFLHALGVDQKYVSLQCDEKTDCSKEGSSIDSMLTADFHDRAYDLVRYVPRIEL